MDQEKATASVGWGWWWRRSGPSSRGKAKAADFVIMHVVCGGAASECAWKEHEGGSVQAVSSVRTIVTSPFWGVEAQQPHSDSFDVLHARACIECVHVHAWGSCTVGCHSFGGRKVRVGRNSDNHTRGFAYVTVDGAKADAAIEQLHNKVAVRMATGTEGAVVDREVDAAATVDLGCVADTLTRPGTQSTAADVARQPHMLSVSRTSGKVDTLFPSLSTSARTRIQMDEVAMFSVTDECVRWCVCVQATALTHVAPCSTIPCPSTRGRYTADRISLFLRSLVRVGYRGAATAPTSVAVDATACVGGNTMSLAKAFDRVVAFEIDPSREKQLAFNLHDVGGWDKERVSTVCADFLESELLKSGRGGGTVTYADAVWCDPPWGGPRYVCTRVDCFIHVGRSVGWLVGWLVGLCMGVCTWPIPGVGL